jgi:hypothetical protein
MRQEEGDMIVCFHKMVSVIEFLSTKDLHFS